jgi:CRISPR system Cascade subunit CasC
MHHITVHTLTSLPLHVPNRGEDGLAKRAVIAGIERQRISYQCQQYALRHSPEFEALEIAAEAGHTYRTTLVGERLLLPALMEQGIDEPESWATAIMALWVKEKKGKAKDEEVIESESDAGADTKTEAESESTGVQSSAAPLIVGEQDIRLLAAVVAACVTAGVKPADLRRLFEKKPSKDTPAEVLTAIQALKVTKASAGLDGALFGRMSTGLAVSNVDRCVRIADAITTGAIATEADFFLVADDLKTRDAGEYGGSHINTRELGGGVFYRQLAIDLEQMRRNGLEPRVIVPGLIAAFISVSPVGDRAAATPVEALVELGGRPRSLMDAYARPIAAPEAAVQALREQARQQHELLGAPEQSLWLSEQAPVKLQSLRTAVSRALGG